MSVLFSARPDSKESVVKPKYSEYLYKSITDTITDSDTESDSDSDASSDDSSSDSDSDRCSTTSHQGYGSIQSVAPGLDLVNQSLSQSQSLPTGHNGTSVAVGDGLISTKLAPESQVPEHCSQPVEKKKAKKTKKSKAKRSAKLVNLLYCVGFVFFALTLVVVLYCWNRDSSSPRDAEKRGKSTRSQKKNPTTESVTESAVTPGPTESDPERPKSPPKDPEGAAQPNVTAGNDAAQKNEQSPGSEGAGTEAVDGDEPAPENAAIEESDDDSGNDHTDNSPEDNPEDNDPKESDTDPKDNDPKANAPEDTDLAVDGPADPPAAEGSTKSPAADVAVGGDDDKNFVPASSHSANGNGAGNGATANSSSSNGIGSPTPGAGSAPAAAPAASSLQAVEGNHVGVNQAVVGKSDEKGGDNDRESESPNLAPYQKVQAKADKRLMIGSVVVLFMLLALISFFGILPNL